MTNPRSPPSLCFPPPSRLPLASLSCMGGASTEQMDFRGDQIGVPLAMGSVQGPPHSLSPLLQPPTEPSGVGDPQHGSFFSPIQGSHRTGGTEHTGFLRQTLRGAQDVGRHETSFGSFSSQPFPPPPSFPYGDPFLHQGLDSQGRLCDVSGPPRCLFPYPHSPSSPEMASFFLERNPIPVQGSSVRPGACPLDFFQGGTGALHSPSQSWNSHQGLLGRLVNPSIQSVSLQPTCTGRPHLVQEAGLYPKLREIRASPVSAVYVPRHPFQHGCLDRLPLSTENPTTPVVPPFTPDSTRSVGLIPSFPPGLNGIAFLSPSFRPSSQETLPTCFSPSLVPVPSGLAPQNSARPMVQRVSGAMAGPSLASGGSPSHSPPSSRVLVHGRFEQGLGRSHGPSFSVRHVATIPADLAYQPSGIGSGRPGSERVSPFNKRQTCSSPHGQHVSPILSEQTRGRPLDISVSESRRSTSLVSGAEDHPDSEAYFRETECVSRSVEQSAYDPAHGMDSRQDCSSSGVGSLVHSSLGSLRDKIQQSPSHIRISSPRPRGMGSRCPQHPLGKSPRIRLSPYTSDRKSAQESSRGERYPDPNSPHVACPIMVPGADTPITRSSSKAPCRSKVPSSTKVRCNPRQPRRTGLTRLATVRSSLSSLGASRDTQEMVLLQHRSGTSNVYTSAWDKWSEWCVSNSVNPCNPLPIQFANYLSHLFKVRNLAALTVKVHRAAISSTMRQIGGPSFADEPLLNAVVKSAALQEAKSARRAPAWDLFLVLKALRSDPYEPIHLISLPHLTRKTAFLLMLASGRRGSEVHALSGTEVHLEADGSLSLNFLPGFLAKNQKPGDPSPKIFIKPLTNILCPDDEDRSLCPVRSLREYRRRTSSMRTSQRGLFLSVREAHKKDISRSSIARWVKQVIVDAYVRAGVSLDGISARPHELRALSASVAFINDCSLQSILDAAYWRSNGVFIDFYLRDTSRLLSDGTRGIGSVVVAQQALSARPTKERRKKHKRK